MRRKLSILSLLFFTLYTYAQDPSVVSFWNVGKMYVENNGGTTIFISQAMEVSGYSASIIQNGTTRIGGNFYQDSNTNAFFVDDSGRGISTGTIMFDDNPTPSTDQKRYITTNSLDISTFNRSEYYVAFPNISISTVDTITLPGKMGIDAKSIDRSGTGVLLLKSEVYNEDSEKSVFDASLRITGSGNSEQLVPAGSVIVERDLSLYRPASGDAPLFAFASPFKTQKGGYFAGNWVRKLLRDPGFYDHTEYVYGNQSANGVIIKEQYLYNPQESFVVNNGYLVKARSLDFNFQDLINTGGLGVTGASAGDYNKTKFVFDGNVYELGYTPEQVFADDILFNKTLNNSAKQKTINWIVGNSYTAAISINSLVNVLSNTDLTFVPTIYVFPAGATTYQPIQVGDGPLQVTDLKDIPAMSIFMVRLSNSAIQKGNFKIDKSMLVHGNTGNNLKQAASQEETKGLRASKAPVSNEEVLFRISPENNDNIYDLAVTGMRSGALTALDKQDVAKIFLTANNAFQLYFVSDDGSKLSANAIPEGTTSTKLSLAPGATPAKLKMKATRQESLENVWLEDLLTGEITDLKNHSEYVFNSTPADNPDRFIVHFNRMPSISTDLEQISSDTKNIQCYYSKDNIVLKGLVPVDKNSTLSIIDIQGRLIKQVLIDNIPEMNIPVSLIDGIYIAKISGVRNVALKFRK